MKRKSHVEVICGSMYSGKSEELIRRIKRAIIANKKVQLFKPKLDNRYSDTAVVTHDGVGHESEIVDNAHHLISLVKEDTEVVGIDEIQFFDRAVVDVASQLTKRGIRVVVAGLDMYSTGEEFGPIGELMVKAKYVTKLHAVCVGCGDDAMYSHAISENYETNSESQVKVGSVGDYIAVCEDCRDKF